MVHNLQVPARRFRKRKTLTPRQRQQLFRREVKNLLIGSLWVGIIAGLVAFTYWWSFVKPNERDSFEDVQYQEYQHVMNVEKTSPHSTIVSKEVIEVECPEPIDTVLIDLGTYQITAYCSCSKCCGKSDGITASQVLARSNHTVAADSNIPFGTKLLINGVTYTVEDRGGAIKGNHIDIYFDTHQEAVDYGIQYHTVFLEK